MTANKCDLNHPCDLIASFFQHSIHVFLHAIYMLIYQYSIYVGFFYMIFIICLNFVCFSVPGLAVGLSSGLLSVLSKIKVIALSTFINKSMLDYVDIILPTTTQL